MSKRSAFLAGFLAAALMVSAAGASDRHATSAQRDPAWSLLQTDFPCAEDEVLGYSPASASHVVCIHVEALP